jgi:peptidoglycan/xylan/chitin deacetylase (PgdA/CDA1 family)
MYHYIRDLANSRYPQIKALDYHLFKQQIEFFKNNFNVITIQEMIAAYDESYVLPENAILLTFDDGYIDHFTYVYPILNEFNLQGSFYIPGKTFKDCSLLDVNKIHFILASTDIQALLEETFKQLDYYRGCEFDIEPNDILFERYAIASRFDSKEVIFVKRLLQTVLPENLRNMISSNIFEKYVGLPQDKFAKELYMNYDQIKCMKNNGMYIGIHGYNHYWLGNLNLGEIQKDFDMALSCMDGLVDTDCWVMNYPYGSWNNDLIDYVKNNGCKIGLTTEVRIADTEIDNPYLLPRMDTNDFPPKNNNYFYIKKV